MQINKENVTKVCIDDFALKKRHNYGSVMIDIDTHKIIDLLESRQEDDDVTQWLKTYPNLEVISRDGGTMYKSASDKAHPNAKQIFDRFHILKNLTDYAKDALKRLLKKQIKINEDEQKEVSKTKKKYEYKTKWDLILKVKELREQKYRIIDIAEFLGISEKSVVEYNKISIIDKEKYDQISASKLKSKTSQKNKWELIQEVQEEYKKCCKYSVVARKFKIDDRTVKKYLNIVEPPINGNKNRKYSSKLDKYKNKIIKMNNEGYTWKAIRDEIQKDGYIGSDSLLRTYLSKIRREKIEEKNLKHIVERTTMISLLYKEIKEVKSITKDIFDKVIILFPEVGKIYEIIKDFKDIMFSKKAKKINSWIKKAKALKIPEICSFINRNRKRFRCSKKCYKI